MEWEEGTEVVVAFSLWPELRKNLGTPVEPALHVGQHFVFMSSDILHCTRSSKKARVRFPLYHASTIQVVVQVQVRRE
jgi:hypothetical protein